MCKKYLIDTNLLYDLSGINDTSSSIDCDVLRSEIAKLGNIYISELSLFELYTHSDFTDSDKQQILDYICQNNINIIQSLPSSQSFINLTQGELLSDSEVIQKILDSKKELEATTLLSCITIVAYIFYYFLYLHIPEEFQSDFTSQAENTIKSNSEHILNESERIIEEQYNKTNLVKNGISSVLEPILYCIFLNYEWSFQGLNILTVKEHPDLYVENKSIPLYEIKDNIIGEIQGSYLSKKALYWDKLQEATSFMNDFFKQNDPEHKNYINYYTHYAWLYFTQGKKFDKNNLIDSHFHFYDDQYTVLTFDKFLLETYKDSPQYSFLCDLLNKTKK